MDTIWLPDWKDVEGPKYLALHGRLISDIEAGAFGDQVLEDVVRSPVDCTHDGRNSH